MQIFVPGQTRGKEEFRKEVIAMWGGIPQEVTEKLYLSLPVRMRAIVSSDGHLTKEILFSVLNTHFYVVLSVGLVRRVRRIPLYLSRVRLATPRVVAILTKDQPEKFVDNPELRSEEHSGAQDKQSRALERATERRAIINSLRLL